MALSQRITFLLAVLLVALTLFVIAQYGPTQRKLRADPSIMLYVGQQLLRGNPPYLTVTIVKTPMTALLAAGAMAGGRLLGVNDVLSARVGFMLLAALLVAVTFLYGRALWSDHAGLFAGLALLGFDGIAQRVTDGPAAKVPFALFGVAALYLALRRHWFAAGAAAALAFLTWQPGGIFVLAVLLAALVGAGLVPAQPALPAAPSRSSRRLSRKAPCARRPSHLARLAHLTRLAPGARRLVPAHNAAGPFATQSNAIQSGAERSRRMSVPAQLRAILSSLAGALTPLALVGLYLALTGALPAALQQTLGASAAYMGESKVGAGLTSVVGQNLASLGAQLPVCFAGEELFLVGGVVGLLGYFAGVARRLLQRQGDAARRAALPLGLVVGGLGAFTLLDVQSCADLLPFFPLLALGLGFLLAELIAWVAARLSQRAQARAVPLLLALVAVALLAYGTRDAFFSGKQRGFDRQLAMAADVSRLVGPADPIQEFGDAVLLVLLNRENALPFIHLGDKQGLGILRAQGLDAADLPVLLERQTPRLLILSRAKDQAWAGPLYNWIESRYTLVDTFDSARGGTTQGTDIYLLR